MTAEPESRASGCTPAAQPSRRRAPLTERQRENLRRHAFKPGHDPKRNNDGVNGTTKARARIEALINASADDMVEVLIQLAKSGDVQALKLVTQHLLPAMPKQAIEMSGGISFSWMPIEPHGDGG